MRIVNEANKIVIGYAGENEAVNVLFDVEGWDELYGSGSFTLLNRRPGETQAYPVEVIQEDEEIIGQSTQNVEMIEYKKENFFQKIISKIINVFKR